VRDLANLLRPKTLEEFVGQKHIIGKDKPLYKLIKNKDIPHMFFYGAPGTGKTSLAKIIATELGSDFYSLNATTFKVDELRKIISRYKNGLLIPLIFIDEVHRLSKNQQEILLPIMENYEAIIIGASTENPFFSLTNAIRSRSFLFEFKQIEEDELNLLLQRALKYLNTNIDQKSKEYLIKSSNGDARAMLTLLDFAFKVDKTLPLEVLKNLRQKALVEGLNSKESHYNIISALIKSLRGSDVDAALFYLAKLIVGREDLGFITRRLVIFASEDIGNANPNALNMALNCLKACKEIGYPEAKIILAQCVVYLASSPKSNSSYKAINKAIDLIENAKIKEEIPYYLIGKNKDYLNPHEFGGYVKQKYLKNPLKIYEGSNIGFEKTLNEWLEKIVSKHLKKNLKEKK